MDRRSSLPDGRGDAVPLLLHVGDVVMPGGALTGAGKSVLLALMALQFRAYPGAQVFAFDFGGSIAGRPCHGRDWHDLGGGARRRERRACRPQPLAASLAGERAGLRKDRDALARESITVTPVDLKSTCGPR